MKEFINKISSYNLFNNLVPGVLFVVLLRETTSFNLVKENLLEGLVLYYFIGLVIGRVGSLVIEPIFKRLKIISVSNFDEFRRSSAIDSKLEILVETNNAYRSLTVVFLFLILASVFEGFILKLLVYKKIIQICFYGILLILFILSFRKQTRYIYKRIESLLKNESGEGKISQKS